MASEKKEEEKFIPTNSIDKQKNENGEKINNGDNRGKVVE